MTLDRQNTNWQFREFTFESAETKGILSHLKIILRHFKTRGKGEDSFLVTKGLWPRERNSGEEGGLLLPFFTEEKTLKSVDNYRKYMSWLLRICYETHQEDPQGWGGSFHGNEEDFVGPTVFFEEMNRPSKKGEFLCSWIQIRLISSFQKTFFRFMYNSWVTTNRTRWNNPFHMVCL